MLEFLLDFPRKSGHNSFIKHILANLSDDVDASCPWCTINKDQGWRGCGEGKQTTAQNAIFIIALRFSHCSDHRASLPVADDGGREEVGYNDFLDMVEKGEVTEVEMGDEQIVFQTKDADGNTALYKTGIWPDDDLVNRLKTAGVEFSTEIPTQTSPILSFLMTWIFPLALFVVLGSFSPLYDESHDGRHKRAATGQIQRGRYTSNRRTVVYVRRRRRSGRGKEALTEIVDFLHNPGKIYRHRREAAQGRAARGPPGHGKTFARQSRRGRGEGAVFLHLRIGIRGRCSSAWARRKCGICSRKPAKKGPVLCSSTRSTPSAKSATTAVGGSNDEARTDAQSVAREMDGFDGRKGVCDPRCDEPARCSLDPALLRPGRF
jgi:cell division protease FtsH